MSIKRSIWLSAAVAGGALASVLPLPVVVFGGSALLFILLIAITPLAALTVLVVLAPLRTLIATEAAIQLPLDIGQLILLAFLSAVFVHGFVLRRKRLHVDWNPLYIPLIIMLVATGLSAFPAQSMSAWLSEWLKWLQMLVLVGVVMILLPARRWQWLIFALVLAGVANAAIGLYEFVGGSGALHLLINDRFFRAFGTFGQPNPFGGFMGLLAPLSLLMMLAYGRRWWITRQQADFLAFMFYAIGSLALLGGIVISWSRGAWLGLVASLTVVMMALPRKTGYGVGLALVVLGVGALLWFGNLLPASIVARISSSTAEFFAFEDVRAIDITPENYPVAERLAHWQAALNMARSNPWLGVGFGNYEVAYPAHRLINWDEPLGHAHNYYLNMFAEGGIIGLAGYGTAWLLIAWFTWKVRQHPDMLSRVAAIGLLGSWVYLAVHSLFDNLYVNNLFLHLGLMLGILGVLYNQISSYVSMRSS